MKGTPPFFIDYSVHTQEGVRDYINVEITVNDAIKLTKDPFISPFYTQDETQTGKTGLYGIKIESGGIYTLTALRESNGDAGKVIATDPVSVASCPTYSWSWIRDNHHSLPIANSQFDKCVDEEVNASMTVTSVMPVTVLYLSKSGTSESIEVVQGGEAHECMPHESPMACSLKLIKSSTVTVFVQRKVENDQMVFKVARLTDGTLI